MLGTAIEFVAAVSAAVVVVAPVPAAPHCALTLAAVAHRVAAAFVAVLDAVVLDVVLLSVVIAGAIPLATAGTHFLHLVLDDYLPSRSRNAARELGPGRGPWVICSHWPYSSRRPRL